VNAVVVVVTPNSLASKLVTGEWLEALGSSKRVIPALSRGARFADLPVELAHIQGVDLNEDFDGGVLQT
jgi:hypothetical protein